ncbi:MAG: glycoside hydrolase family 66 protein [Bacteroidales bacterium]|jgi:dextranase|nr:glycoside hydrolase family 66 protein [Bacteroidales bacterium]MCI2121677.1 glycoside hydrolase family 66 protein [Bacteroidales bacterium]MCI2144642.1 glycoside hydrolase family 66 protein [Bacteroidales bacterium]
MKIGFFSLLNAVVLMMFATGACSQSCSKSDTPGGVSPDSTSVLHVNLKTDKVCFSPGEEVSFTADELPDSAYVRYYHLGKVLDEKRLSVKTWSWAPPSSDYQGYLAVVLDKNNGRDDILGSIAVDVSSTWNRFPRYGFLAAFGDMDESEIESNVSMISRCHLNGVQFQDWHWKHQRPLAGTPENPYDHWTDIAKRSTSKATVEGYISCLHGIGSKAMFYDLCFGALNDAADDGVKEEWYLFNDRNHSSKNVLTLPSPMFKSDIYIVDPSLEAWQTYFGNRVDDVYSVFDFDGYQIDQLGSRGTVYDYDGSAADLPSGYASFIRAMKSKRPGKHLVMNSVSRFGDKEIAETGDVDFLYNEVWSEDADFSSLKDIIDRNDSFGDGSLKTVFAAYMDYDKADGTGYFNTPGVLLTDAVMFALGGSHLELGDHMLCKEYFPNTNLSMDAILQSSIIRYYDFMTAYENLLRDGVTFGSAELSCLNGKMTVAAWPPSSGKVCLISTEKGSDTEVLHLINLAGANSMSWRDLDGTMPEPSFISEPSFKFKTTRQVKAVWMASPDSYLCTPRPVEFTQSASCITFSIPSLKYWDMIVIEY